VEYQLQKNENWLANLVLPELGTLPMLEKAEQNCVFKANQELQIFSGEWVQPDFDSVPYYVSHDVTVHINDISGVIFQAQYDKSMLVELYITLNFRDTSYRFPDWAGYSNPLLGFERELGGSAKTRMFTNSMERMISNGDLVQISQNFCPDSMTELFQFKPTNGVHNARVLLFNADHFSVHSDILGSAKENKISDRLTDYCLQEKLKAYRLTVTEAGHRLVELEKNDPMKQMLFRWEFQSSVPLADENGDPMTKMDNEGNFEYIYGSSFTTPKGRAAMNYLRILEVRNGSRPKTFFSFMEYPDEDLKNVPWFSFDEFEEIEGKSEFATAVKKNLSLGFQTHQLKIACD
jgi:hypothetical protein